MEFSVVRNDISLMDTDAIVVPSNRYLKPGSGAAKSVFEKAGEKELIAACEKLIKKNGKLDVGEVAYTLGYSLKAKYIIHAAVPRWQDGKKKEYELLSATYLCALHQADEIGCKSIAFPILAAGNNGFNLGLAIKIAHDSVLYFQPKYDLKKVILVPYDSKAVNIFKDSGMKVIELIDEEYVLKNDAEYKPLLQKEIEQGFEKIRKIAEDGKNIVKGALDDPKFKKNIGNIAQDVAIEAARVALKKENLMKYREIGAMIIKNIIRK